MSRKEVIDHFKWYYDHGYITARDGNAAFKNANNEGLYEITITGAKKNDLKLSDFAFVNEQGPVTKRKPSIEAGAHLTALRQSGKNASVHVHSPNTVALAALYEKSSWVYPDSKDLIHNLMTKWPELFRYTNVGHAVPFLEPGSKKLHDSIIRSLGPGKDDKKWNDICIMQRHGVLAIGDSLEECMEHIVRLEHISTILLKIITANGKLESIL